MKTKSNQYIEIGLQLVNFHVFSLQLHTDFEHTSCTKIGITNLHFQPQTEITEKKNKYKQKQPKSLQINTRMETKM